MSLLFDLTASQPNGSGKRHGGGKYCEMLFFAMCSKKINFKAFYDSSKYITPEILIIAKKADVIIFDIARQNLQDLISSENITSLYSALPEQIQPWPKCKILGTIHGLRNYEMPFDFFARWQFDSGLIGLSTLLAAKRYRKNKKKSLRYYQQLLNQKDFSFVTDSEYSKKIILSIECEKEIPVFFPPSTTLRSEIRTSDDYFFMVSANRIEKNCIRAIIALDKLYSKGLIPFQKTVKITGLTESNFRYKLLCPRQFEFLGYVGEDELSKLYANSWCFIYPSLNEGFGYPPLEAMKYGVPVIASNAASIPEVCGKAALYFNPKSIAEIKKRIVDIQDKCIYSNLQKKGMKRFEEIEARQKEDLEKLIDWIIFNSS